jgi:hypothetical protein
MPRLTIERTPVNDVRVILDALLPARTLATLVRDPAALAGEYRAELRAIANAAALRLSHLAVHPADANRAPTPNAGPTRAPEANPTPSRRRSRGSSDRLLR